MVTEFKRYSLSGVFICVCGQHIMVVGAVRPGYFKCEGCEREFTVKRPVIQLMDRENREDRDE